jgi:hypothetical protein
MKKLTLFLFVLLSIIFILFGCNNQSKPDPIYAITFYTEDGDIYYVTTVRKGMEVVLPNSPSKIGHQFIGWTPNLQSITNNMEVYPMFEKETYKLFIHYLNQQIEMPIQFDDEINLSPPQQQGYQLIGFYMDSNYQIPFIYENMPAFSLNVYLKYEPLTYQLHIENELYDTLYFNYLDPITLNEISIEGYQFSGWYFDEFHETVFDLDYMPAQDLIIYPKYEPILYTLKYITNSEIEIDDTYYYFQDSIELPSLESDHLSFLGWYIDEDLLTSFDFSFMPSYNLTIYAKWENIKPSFIQAIGDQLYLNDQIFRFVSFNIPNLHILEDPYWHMVDPFEQEDALHSIHLMGGQVARIYTFSIVGGIRPSEGNNELAHIMGIETYNEALFQSLDKALELASKYGIYLIIPFIDEWNWFGGISEFSALYGQNRNAFFTNPTVKEGFKHFMSYVLNRVNIYTGIAYKDDPNILAFELGNELRSAPNAWINEMAAYFKSIDSNHLLMSGRDEVTTNDLNNPNIDIINAHYYTNNGTGTFASRAARDRALTKNIKPFIIGEYGLVSYSEIEAMIIESVENGTSGSLIWSLRFRNVNGGFYYHDDFPTRSYHYPGFEINQDYDEIDIINLITFYAHYVQGLDIIPPPIPEAPVLFEIFNASLTWQGQTASKTFIIERRIFGETSWLTIATDVIDAYEEGPFFIDLEGQDGVLYEYRVIAVNETGVSIPSNVVQYTYKKTIEKANLALNQTILASSIENDQGFLRYPHYANDGLMHTRWSSIYEDNQWIEIIFSKVSTVDTMIIHFEAAYAKQFRVLGSLNQIDYFVLYETNNSNGGIITIEVEPIDILYLKIDLILRATQWGFSIFEIEVY